MPSRPEFFRLFLILIPVITIMIWNFFAGRKSLRNIAGSWRSEEFYELYTVKRFFSFLGLIVFIVFSILSVAGFPGREIPVSYEPAGTDIVFAVDISESMRAQDVYPSRLEAAKRLINSICENTPDGRFGVIVFKGRAINMIPSTEDAGTVYSFLEFLSTDLLTSPGSSLEAGISAGLSAFTTGEERRKYLILISDGEALSGSIEQVLLDAVKQDVVIYTVGAGTAEGANIPAADGGVLLDSSGNPVLSRLNEKALRDIAVSTGGTYYSVESHTMLPELLRIAAGTVESEDSRYRIVVKEKYRVFLIVALIGLFISRAVKVVKWKKDF